MSIVPFTVGMTLTSCCFLFFIFLMIVYFRKNAKYNLKNFLYRRMLYFGLCGFLFEFLFLIISHFSIETTVLALTKKFVYLSFMASLSLWAYYVIIVAFEKNKELSNTIRKNHASIDLYMLLAFGTMGLILLFLPVQFQENANHFVEYMNGPGIVFADIMIGIISLVPIPFILANRKSIYQKRLFAYYFQIILTGIMIYVHYQFPAYSLITFPYTMCMYMIYSRLENPDLIYVRKFKKNSDRMKEIRENYGFIFHMSPELKALLNEASVMRDEYVFNHRISRKRLETLLTNFIRGNEDGPDGQPHLDDDGIEILDYEEDDTPEEMLITKEIYSLNELQEVLKEDNLPKW